jgi:hypothetical protein
VLCPVNIISRDHEVPDVCHEKVWGGIDI